MTQVSGGVDQDMTLQRRMMVDGQIRTFDVTDQRVLASFYRTPRETCLPQDLAPLAYSDAPLVLPLTEAPGSGRTLMQPMFLAKLLQNASLDESDRVLVVAGATGYAAAVVAPLVASVVTLESDPGLSARALAYITGLGLEASIAVVTGPLQVGHPDAAPYDRIIVCGAVEAGLDGLFAQLSEGGCLLAVETGTGQATRRSGKAVRYDRIGAGVSVRTLFDATLPVLDAFRKPDAFVF